jgi:two-component system, NarL family, sensor kinase
MQIPTDHIILLVVLLTLIFLLGAGFLLLYVSLYNQRKKKHLEEKKAIQASFDQELLKTRLEIQESTLRHISQEIHDNFSQTLGFVKLNISTANPENSVQVAGVLERAKQLVGQVINDMRHLSHSLSPDYLEDQGLQALIAQHLQQLEKTGQYATQFTVTGHPERFSPQQELVLLRTVQELLHNTVKHAGAKAITVHMGFAPGHLELTVSDNGKGFDLAAQVSETTSTTGLGLINLRKRMEMVGGQFTLISEPGKGTTATFSI